MIRPVSSQSWDCGTFLSSFALDGGKRVGTLLRSRSLGQALRSRLQLVCVGVLHFSLCPSEHREAWGPGFREHGDSWSPPCVGLSPQLTPRKRWKTFEDRPPGRAIHQTFGHPVPPQCHGTSEPWPALHPTPVPGSMGAKPRPLRLSPSTDLGWLPTWVLLWSGGRCDHRATHLTGTSLAPRDTKSPASDSCGCSPRDLQGQLLARGAPTSQSSSLPVPNEDRPLGLPFCSSSCPSGSYRQQLTLARPGSPTPESCPRSMTTGGPCCL